MLNPTTLAALCDFQTARLGERPRIERRLSDLRGCFHDSAAYEAALSKGDPLVYTVSSIEPGVADGDMHYGLGMLMPGRIGSEYWMTKGHLHSWRAAAEVYIGLRGTGAMLLEDEGSGETQLVALVAGGVVYVPGNTAHRTINTGTEPLFYLGVYPAKAGHDYAAIAKSNFRYVAIESAGQPTLVRRTELS